MNRGAGGCEYPRQDSRAYRRFDNQVTSSSRLSHRVSHVRSDSKRHLKKIEPVIQQGQSVVHWPGSRVLTVSSGLTCRR